MPPNAACPICELFLRRTSCRTPSSLLDSLGRRARSASRTKPSPRAVGGSRRSTRTVDESETDSANKEAPPGASLFLYGPLVPGEAQQFGLPGAIRACLFDLDGVLTQTAKVHAAAWKEMFDAYLLERANRTGERFVPFDPVADYDQYVDGKPRYDGVRSFLASRGIELPEGDPNDPPSAETVHGLGNRKNELVLALLKRDGVEAYEDSVRYVQAVRAAGLHTAVVFASANCNDVLEAAGIEDLF